MKTVVIIQARMTSTRLPGKVLMTLGRRSVLGHVITRAKSIPGVDAVCIAAPMGPDGDPIEAEARACGAEVFRGSESDVLDRYWQAAKAMKADIILRVTSDSPMLDPAIYGAALARMLDTGADYVSNNNPPSWPHGLDCEVFSFEWLDRAAREADKPSEREHVTPFIRNHSEAHTDNLEGPSPSLNHYRWTLDTPEDFKMMEILFQHLPEDPLGWRWQTALKTVDAIPGLKDINASYDPLAGLKTSLEEDDTWARTWLLEQGKDEAYSALGFTLDFADSTGRRILSLRRRDLLPIMEWRNEQMVILRQAEPLTLTGQKKYYETAIQPTFTEDRPRQILVSYLHDGALIGYGGLTNIDWSEKSAEVSFLLETRRSEDIALHCDDFRHYLALLMELAFDHLSLERLHSETYDIRPHHVEILEKMGFEPRGRLAGHATIGGRPVDSLLHEIRHQAG